MIAGINQKAHREVGFRVSAGSHERSAAKERGHSHLRMRHRGLVAQRWLSYAVLATLVALVSDGWAGKPSPLLHQLLLLPVSAISGLVLVQLLRAGSTPEPQLSHRPPEWPWVVASWWVCFELLSVLMMEAEERHFARFGYHWSRPVIVAAAVLAGFAWAWYVRSRSSLSMFAALVLTYAGGVVVAIRDFPLNYLRSDMLPVIGWADGRLVRGLNPYATMHVGSRVYDFPYLPGVLVSFWPAAVLKLDLRWATLLYTLGIAGLIFAAAHSWERKRVLGLLGLFLLCPFLQYRHDLYLQPHWFTVALAVVLMQTGRWRWSAVVWGCSCAIYQLSWVVVPFFLLWSFRRRGTRGAVAAGVFALLGALAVAGPFLPFAAHQVASNTVGQWNRMPHALAEPMNVSYWLTYVIQPDQLRWVQAVVLTALFGFCVVRHKCATTPDTLRWMTCALALFIPLNVLVDGYFYLTLLLFVLLFLCSAEGLWRGAPGESASPLDEATLVERSVA